MIDLTRTVSTRISNSLHEQLRDACNKVGCSISEYLAASLELTMLGHTEFDFGDEDGEDASEESIKPADPPRVYHLKLPEK